MQSIISRAKAFLKSEDGPTATEYAVMLALIIVVCIASIKAIGPKANAAFKSVGDNM
jgi:pilus assembly protein Flp/PilA